jgi:hypothetical protein
MIIVSSLKKFNNILKGLHIVSELMKHGKATSEQLRTVCEEKFNAEGRNAEDNDDEDDFQTVFETLVNQQYILDVQSEDSKSALDQKLIDEAAELASAPHMASEILKRRKKSRANAADIIEFETNNATGSVRLNSILYVVPI